MDRVPTKFDFDFEPFPTGLYTLQVKETSIVNVDRVDEDMDMGKGIKNDFNFVINFTAEGGEMDGKLHIERYPHLFPGNIGLQKLQGAMIKMGGMKMSSDPKGHEISLFDSPDFRKRFEMLAGKKVVAIIRRQPSKTTKREFSNIIAYYEVSEMAKAKADFEKKFKTSLQTAATQPPSPLPGAGSSSSARDDW